MEKIFKKIPSFPKYIVSNSGTIINTRSGKIRKQKQNKSGYMVVGMFKQGKRITIQVHRLVAEAFIQNNGYPQVNHKNGIKTDNRPENLEWCSASHNNTHAYRILGRPLPKSLLKGKERSKKCLVTKGFKTGVFESITEASKQNRCKKHIFIRIANGKKTHLSQEFNVTYI